ncbi:hypothetical protein KTD31_02770 [Burkholderia multivorans]|uniref:hypothetical protein n=1 Tax=Burkholderia multivorans TaxID=87883 RepID=UPI001C221558|nr:hypothetical protein [Burkholderia multivorans]MBU9200291.1 hypothetical protein [Burkholderia multivorans]MDN8078583.1 hypothetical protein [Burkholderia multivorans]
MKKIVVLAALFVPLLLAACAKQAVTDHHIQMASDKCDANGGLQAFEQASLSPETESCGYKCSRRTGRYEYQATFSCKNGAKFDLTWTE